MCNRTRKMWGLTIFLVVATVSSVMLYQQNKYEILSDRAEVASFNKNYVKLLKIENAKCNRTLRVFTVTMMASRDITEDLRLEIVSYKFVSNEFRPFPIDLAINLCESLDKDLFGFANIKSCGNFTGCNFKKDVAYVVCNWHPDYEKFPPLIPQGSYKLNIKFMIRETQLADLIFYGKVVYKLV